MFLHSFTWQFFLSSLCTHMHGFLTCTHIWKYIVSMYYICVHICVCVYLYSYKNWFVFWRGISPDYKTWTSMVLILLLLSFWKWKALICVLFMFLTNFVSKRTNKIVESGRDYFICNSWSCIQKREIKEYAIEEVCVQNKGTHKILI